MSVLQNNHSVLVLAPSTMGKTFCLRNLPEFGKTVYINTDGKPLPFRTDKKKFIEVLPGHPDEIPGIIEKASNTDVVTNIVLDTFTTMADARVDEVVEKADDKWEAWGGQKSFLNGIVKDVKMTDKNFVVLAHETMAVDEDSGTVNRYAHIQGGFGKIGLEAHFSTIIGCTSIRPSTMKGIVPENDLLVVTEYEKEDDIKYVFQTRRVASTPGAKYRAPNGVWSRNELYIDNDIVPVIKRLDEYFS